MTSILRNKGRDRLDAKLAVIKPLDRFAAPPKGWIRAIRDALGMSGVQLGRRLGVTAQGVLGLERSEASGRIQLDTLRRAAEAMDCVLVYAVVPRTSLQDMVDRRAHDIAVKSLDRISHSMALEDQAVDRARQERIEAFLESSIRERDLWEQL